MQYKINNEMHLLAVADPKQNEVHAYMHVRNLDTQFDILKNCDVYTIKAQFALGTSINY